MATAHTTAENTPALTWTGFTLALLGAIAFSGKAIIIKLAYRHGVDAVALLMWRMLLALPMFLLLSWWAGRGQPKLTARDWRDIGLLGFTGYYLASYLDFAGLQYISASEVEVTRQVVAREAQQPDVPPVPRREFGLATPRPPRQQQEHRQRQQHAPHQQRHRVHPMPVGQFDDDGLARERDGTQQREREAGPGQGGRVLSSGVGSGHARHGASVGGAAAFCAGRGWVSVAVRALPGPKPRGCSTLRRIRSA
jgi:hypothetical protein